MAKPKMDTVIQNMTPEQKAQNLVSIAYIKTLAAQFSTDISKWDINKIFGVENDDMNLVCDKRQLNTLFLAFYEKQKQLAAEKKAENVVDAEEATEQLINIAALKTEVANVAKASRQRQISSETALLNDNEYHQTAAWKNYNKYNDLILANRQNIRNLENASDDTSTYDKSFADIQKVIDKKLWVNPVFDNGMLYLNTSCNIMLHQVQKAANLDMHIDFGQLAVRIDVRNNFGITVIPYKNNITINGGYYHPHIYQDARICWGEAQTVAMKALKDLDIAKVLEILHALLNNYNPASPIRALADYKLQAQKLGRVSEAMKHPDKRKPPKEKPVEVPLENVGAVFDQAIVPAVAPIADNTGY